MSDETMDEPAGEALADEPEQSRPFNSMDEAADVMRGFFPDDEPAQEAGADTPEEGVEEALEPEPAVDEPTFEIEVAGEKRQVPLSELQAAYTDQSTQQPADPAFTEAQVQALNQGNAERQGQDEWAQQARTYLTSPLPEPPDPGLRETDVVEYLTQKDVWNQELADRQQLQTQLQGVEAQRHQEAEQSHQRLLATEWSSLQKHHPDITTPERYKSFTAEIHEVAKHYGFRDEEMLNWWDHRQIRMAADALKTVRANTAAPEVAKRVASKPPVLRQSGRVAADGAQTRAYKEARTRLRKTGTRHDAAAVFRNFV